MGPAEPRHLPRIVDSLRKGLLLFDFGDQHGAIVDFIGVENVVQVRHLLILFPQSFRDLLKG